MKKNKYGILLLFLFIYTVSPSQNSEPVYTVVGQMPEFKGGENELMWWIARNANKSCRETCRNIRVYVSFIVNKKGKVTSPKILRSSNNWQCDSMILTLFGKMPDWIPGKQNGKPVNVEYSIPFSIVDTTRLEPSNNNPPTIENQQSISNETEVIKKYKGTTPGHTNQTTGTQTKPNSNSNTQRSSKPSPSQQSKTNNNSIGNGSSVSLYGTYICSSCEEVIKLFQNNKGYWNTEFYQFRTFEWEVNSTTGNQITINNNSMWLFFSQENGRIYLTDPNTQRIYIMQ